eukprot:9012911-Prorocentrum_lima.AAC.1
MVELLVAAERSESWLDSTKVKQLWLELLTSALTEEVEVGITDDTEANPFPGLGVEAKDNRE